MTETDRRDPRGLPHRDLVVARAITRVPVPSHRARFWDELEARLASDDTGTAADDGPGRPPTAGLVLELPAATLPGRDPVARRRAVAVAAAAVLLVVATAAALVAGRSVDDPGPIVPAGTAEEGPPASGQVPAPTTTSAPSTAVVPVPGSEAAVLGFLDALGRGDLDGAASRLGPRSEAYLVANAGSVDGVLAEATEGYGAWAAVEDRTTQVIALGPGEVVVVVSGRLEVEGNVEERHDAFPARYAESAGVWFVEPWAFDPATGGRLELAEEPKAEGVAVVTPAVGTAWLSVDGGPPRDAATTPVAGGATAVWRFPEPLAPGPHVFVVAFTDEATFSAMAVSRTVG